VDGASKSCVGYDDTIHTILRSKIILYSIVLYCTPNDGRRLTVSLRQSVTSTWCDVAVFRLTTFLRASQKILTINFNYSDTFDIVQYRTLS